MSAHPPLRRKRGRPHTARQLTKTLAALCLVLGLCAGAMRGQQATPGIYAGFEGRTVSRVDISVGPSMNAEVFRSLIRQKAGEPFSAAAIRESVTALQATKKFSQVQVSIEPEELGLGVLFILQPTSYVGVISFPGATNAFPYTRLLQAVDIPEQSPYFEDLLARGQRSLLRFVQEEGYFAASVQPEIERDDLHRVVNLVFRTDLKSRAQVGHISLEGVSAREASQILQGLGSLRSKLKRRSLTPGQNYSPQRIQRAGDYIRSYLRGEDRLAPMVRHLSSEYDPGSNRARVTFQIDPGPLVFVRVTGAHVSKGTLRREVPIYEENAVDRELVEEGERGLVDYFQSQGYFDVKIDTQYEQRPGRVMVDYHVDRGKRHRVKRVYFQGNRYFSDDRLEAISSIKKGRSFLGYTFTRGKFNQDLLRNSVDALTGRYKNAGFADVSLNPKVEEAGAAMNVTFQIAEGAQDKVGSIRVEGNRTQPLRVLSAGKPLKLQTGKPYSPYRQELDRNQILATYFDLGYLNASFQSAVTTSADNPHLMNVVYTITEGPQGHISAVVPLGEKVTRPSFLQSMTAPNVSKGKPLSQGKFLAAESDLYNLNIFDWVSVKPLQPANDQTQDEVLVKVHESKRYAMDIGGGIEVIPRSGNIPVGTVALPGLPTVGLGSKFTVSQKSFFGPRFSFSLARHNMLGRAETATISTVISRLNQSGAFTYADPRLGGSTWSSLFSLSAERSTESPLYTAALGQGSFQVEKALDIRRTKNLIFRYRFRRTDLSKLIIPDLVLPRDQRVRLSTFSAEYVRDTRDNPLDAHRGVFQTFDFAITPTALGSSANFVRLLGQSAFYIPVRPWLTWANDIRLGFAIPFAESAVPLSERFLSGGADSLRGFPINGAGPQRPVQACSNPSDPSTCTLISVPVGGDMLFILNSEARFPIKLIANLGGVFFYDGGNVYRNINFNQWTKGYTNTVGVGLRYRTPVGPIRFDVGYRLTSISGVEARQYFVTLGQSF
jgi:outer membrane protein insertion porin family